MRIDDWMFDRRLSKRLQSAMVLGLFFAAGCSPILGRPSGSGRAFGILEREAISGAGAYSSNETANACFATADELDRAGHRREAILLYERARQHDPALVHVSRRLAVLYDLVGDTARARLEFEQALQQQPDDISLLNDYGHYHLRHGNLSEAEVWLRKAVAADPRATRPRINLAVLLARRGDLDASLSAFSDVVGPTAAHSNMGVILAKQKRIPEAIEHFEAALSLDSNHQVAKAFLRHLTDGQAEAASAIFPVTNPHSVRPPDSCGMGSVCAAAEHDER